MENQLEKRKLGRPRIELTDLPPDWREIIIDHMGRGFSKEYVASLFGISFKTLYNMMEREPDLVEAIEIGKTKCLQWWEEQGKEGLWKLPKSKRINEKMYLLQFRNRFPELYISEKNSIEIKEEDGSTITVRFATDTTNISES